jgi:hypothetical protein
MAQLPAERRRSGRRLLIAGVAIMLVAVGSLIFLAADAGDTSPAQGPTPAETSGLPTTQPGPGESANPGEGPGSTKPPPPEQSGPGDGTSPSPEQSGPPPEATPVSASSQSLIGQITALIGALTGLIVAVTGLIKILRTRTTED